MHSSVLQSEKYIEFCEENTVEVLALGRLDEAIQKNEPKAAEYDAKDEAGQPVKYMREWPGLTKEQMIALASSKAASYNDTRQIPFTCFVDPWTEKEMQRFPGAQSAKTLMEAALVQKQKLVAEHGPSTSRVVLNKVTAEAKRIVDGLPKAGAAKSMAEYRKLEKSAAKETDTVKKRLEPALQAILDAATADLDQAESLLGGGDVAGAKKIADKLVKPLDGTPLADRAKELAEKIKAAQPAK